MTAPLEALGQRFIAEGHPVIGEAIREIAFYGRIGYFHGRESSETVPIVPEQFNTPVTWTPHYQEERDAFEWPARQKTIKEDADRVVGQLRSDGISSRPVNIIERAIRSRELNIKYAWELSGVSDKRISDLPQMGSKKSSEIRKVHQFFPAQVDVFVARHPVGPSSSLKKQAK